MLDMHLEPMEVLRKAAGRVWDRQVNQAAQSFRVIDGSDGARSATWPCEIRYVIVCSEFLEKHIWYSLRMSANLALGWTLLDIRNYVRGRAYSQTRFCDKVSKDRTQRHSQLGFVSDTVSSWGGKMREGFFLHSRCDTVSKSITQRHSQLGCQIWERHSLLPVTSARGVGRIWVLEAGRCRRWGQAMMGTLEAAPLLKEAERERRRRWKEGDEGGGRWRRWKARLWVRNTNKAWYTNKNC